jgi:hypothetical protein
MIDTLRKKIFFVYFPKCVEVSEIRQRVSEGISILQKFFELSRSA